MPEVMSDENDQLELAQIDYGNDVDYQKELRKKLLERIQRQERAMLADQKLNAEARREDAEYRRDFGTIDVLNRAAAQIGAIGGKVADTSAVTDNAKRLIDAQGDAIALERADRGEKNRLNQYLMGKLLEQEGQVAASRTKQQQSEMEEAAAMRQAERERAKLAQDARFKNKELALKEKEMMLKQQPEGPMGKKATQVPGSVAAELGQFDSALAMADDTMKSYMQKASQPGSSVKSFLPGADANQYEKERDVTAQAIGTILEGGKLTEPDYQRYKAMLPSPTDTNQVAETKIAAIKNLISQRRKGKIEGLRQTGFDVSGVTDREPTGFAQAKPGDGQAMASPAKPNAQDAAALKFLQENPMDPRAEGIKAKLKAKGIL